MTSLTPLTIVGILILVTLLVYIFRWFSDKRRIRAYLERRGATQIAIRLYAVIPIHRGWSLRSRQSKCIYKVNYVSATGQAKETFCTSSNDWWEGKEIIWNDTGSDFYDLVPTAQMRTTGLNSTQATSPHGYSNPLTMRKSQQK
ncbi:MAG: hypothetical protein U0350_03540 [Caldilineaceae bacterium]